MCPIRSLILLSLVLPSILSLNLNFPSECTAAPSYICMLTPTTGNSVTGKVVFSPFYSTLRPRRNCLLRIRAIVENLSEGSHGFHVHTYGDVSEADASSAGGHFTNSRGEDLPHGYPTDRRRHWGDFGNLTAGSHGRAIYDRVDPVARYRSVLGRSVVIHADPDMGADEQPSGNSGPRQASCVIGFANPDLLTGFFAK